jgi:hypothetical protein
LFFQLIFAALTLDGMAFVIFVWAYANPTSSRYQLLLSLCVVYLVLGIVLSVLGVYKGNRLSQKRIDATRANLQRQIEQYRQLLAEPPA